MFLVTPELLLPTVRLTGPSTFLRGSAVVYNCLAQGTKAETAAITWAVRGEDGAELEHTEHAVTSDTGDLASVMELPANTDKDSIIVTCTVDNKAGVVRDEMLVKKIGNYIMVACVEE